MQCDRPLAFDGFFVVGMTLGVFVACVRASTGSQLFAARGSFGFAVGEPANTRAELMSIVHRHAISNGAYALGFGFIGIYQVNVQRHDHFPDQFPPLAAG